MMELLDNKTLSSEGAKAGLIFGTISGGYILLAPLINGLGTTGGIINYILSFGKIIGLMWLMKFYMVRLHEVYEDATRKQTFLFGLYTAFFSALITGACAYVTYSYAYPDLVHQTLTQAAQLYEAPLDGKIQESLAFAEENFGLISLISNFIWCFIYGCGLSLFLSKIVAAKANKTENEEEENE